MVDLFEGRPQQFQWKSWKFHELTGTPRRVADFTPEALLKPVGMHSDGRPAELVSSTSLIYETPLPHRTQQIFAQRYALSEQGYDKGPVEFIVQWAYFEPGLFTCQWFPQEMDNRDWRGRPMQSMAAWCEWNQEKTEEKFPSYEDV